MRQATFDTETDGLLDELEQVWCAVVKSKEDGVVRFTPDSIHELCNYLSTFDALVGHNIIGFDFPALRKVYGWEYHGEKIDTLLMSRIQRPFRRVPKACPLPDGPHSLGVWGWRLGHAKVIHEDWTQFSEDMMHRCEEDVHINEEVYAELLKEGEGEGWGHCHRLNRKLFHWLQLQEEHGWLIDQPLMNKNLYRLNRWIDRIDIAIDPHLPMVVEIEETKKDGTYGWVRKPFKKDGTLSKSGVQFVDRAGASVDMVGGPFSRINLRPVDLDSNVEVKEYLLGLGWIPKEWNTNNVGKRTSPKLSKDDDFEGIQGGLGKLIVKRVQCKQRRGIIEGWQEKLRPDGRLTPKVAGMAATGRLRHSVIVNVPSANAFFGKSMRQMFIASPGKVIVGVDSKGNQLRQLAAHMKDDEFTHAVLHGSSEDGTDLHSLNQKRSGVPTRTKAKNFFYGIIFGAQAKRVAEIIGGTVEQGKKFLEDYFKEMPLLRTLIDEETAKWKATAQRWFNPRFNRYEYKNGYITGLDGRPIQVKDEHTILVYMLQSDESIQMAAAYCWFHWQMEKHGYEWGKDYATLIWMHDEFQIECHPHMVTEVATIGKESIAWAGRHFNIDCPHDGDSKIGHNWYETH